VIAGNDAHGDFSRTRKIGFPFLSAKENNDHRFGVNRTLVPSAVARPEIISSVKKGLSVISNGPFITMNAIKEESTISTGMSFNTNALCTLEAISTEEFGSLFMLRLYVGIIGNSKESILKEWRIEKSTMHFKADYSVHLNEKSYIRAEVTTETNYYAATNPIWITI
jgi:hypothetical protein